MDLCYTVFDPTGNITLLVTSTVPRSAQPKVAAELLRREKDAEQVGFVEYTADNRPRLQMMGGEFCGNATMSFGAWLCQHEPKGESCELLLEVSGTEEQIPCAITPLYRCALGTVTMPLPEKIEGRSFLLNGQAVSFPVVFFPGICHIIVPAGVLAKEDAEVTLRTWAKELPYDAVGVLLLNEETLSFEPLVFVKPTDTAVWENGCGSGTAAIACWLTVKRQAPQCVSLKQPGGTIAAVTAWDGSAVTSLTITGTVKQGKEQVTDVFI